MYLINIFQLRVKIVAYELKFPPSLRIHPIFHVSQLRGLIMTIYFSNFIMILNNFRGKNIFTPKEFEEYEILLPELKEF